MLLPTIPLLLSLVTTASPEVRFDWRAPAECPSAAEVLEDVERLTGRPIARGPVRLVVSATVTADPWRAEFEARSVAGSSRRTLFGESCAALARATGVIVAIALADVRRADPGAPWPDPPRVPLPAVLTTPPLRTRWPTTISPWIGAAGHAGILGEPGGELAGGLSVTRNVLRLRIGAFGRFGPDETREGRELGYGSAGGTLDGCWVHPRLRFELEACGGIEVGAWWVDDRRSEIRQAVAWLAGRAELGFGFKLVGPLWLHIRGGLGVPVSRPRVQVTTVQGRPDLNLTVFRPWWAHPRLQIGISGHFR